MSGTIDGNSPGSVSRNLPPNANNSTQYSNGFNSGISSGSGPGSGVNATITQIALGEKVKENEKEKGGNQLLNTRGVAQIWGKKPDPIAPVSTLITNQNLNSILPTTSTSTSAVSSSSSTSFLGTPHPTQSLPQFEVVPIIPRELTEREKMAKALFGGGTKSTPIVPKDPRKNIPQNNLISLQSVSTAKLVPPSPDFMNLNATFDQSKSSDTDLINSLKTEKSTSELFPVLEIQKNNFDSHSQSLAAPSPRGNNNDNNNDNDLILNKKELNISSSNGETVSQLNSNIDGLMIKPIQTLPQKLPRITPLTITTQQFGLLWSEKLQLPHTTLTGITQQSGSGSGQKKPVGLMEWKCTSPCNLRSLEGLRERICGTGCYDHVESIPATGESIYSAECDLSDILGYTCDNDKNKNNDKNDNNICRSILIHIKLQPMRPLCDLIVRAPSIDLCQLTIKNIASVL